MLDLAFQRLTLRGKSKPADHASLPGTGWIAAGLCGHPLLQLWSVSTGVRWAVPSPRWWLMLYVLIVDDASPDGSGDIAEALAADDLTGFASTGT